MRYLKLFESNNIDDYIKEIEGIKYIVEDEGFNVLIDTPHPSSRLVRIAISEGGKYSAFIPIKGLSKMSWYVEFKERLNEISYKYGWKKYGDLAPKITTSPAKSHIFIFEK